LSGEDDDDIRSSTAGDRDQDLGGGQFQGQDQGQDFSPPEIEFGYDPGDEDKSGTLITLQINTRLMVMLFFQTARRRKIHEVRHLSSIVILHNSISLRTKMNIKTSTTTLVLPARTINPEVK
jgi:hypothetical protein